MSETKFTPGPWGIRQDFIPSEHGTVEVYNQDNKWIASALGTHVGAETKEQAAANAKLIAAAPDMFDAIQSALKIKQLWVPSDDISIEHEGEAQALQSMLTAFEAVIAKIN